MSLEELRNNMTSSLANADEVGVAPAPNTVIPPESVSTSMYGFG